MGKDVVDSRVVLQSDEGEIECVVCRKLSSGSGAGDEKGFWIQCYLDESGIIVTLVKKLRFVCVAGFFCLEDMVIGEQESIAYDKSCPHTFVFFCGKNKADGVYIFLHFFADFSDWNGRLPSVDF